VYTAIGILAAFCEQAMTVLTSILSALFLRAKYLPARIEDFSVERRDLMLDVTVQQSDLLVT